MVGSDDDDESTQKDDDSNDSDSGDSSATITSNTSQSENRSFSLSLSNLCYFSGTDVESDNDNDDWQLPGRRSASLSSDVSAFSCVSLLPSDELDKLVEEVKNLGEETLQDYDDVQVVVLHKEVGVGLGFSLAGGVDQNKPVTVHKVFNSGVAAQEGSISEGDHVLSINGTAFSKSTHGEALRTLKKAKSREMAVVVVRKGDLSQTETQYETGERRCFTKSLNIKYNVCVFVHFKGQRVCIQLEKNSRGLGFSLKGGGDSYLGNRPLTVQKIFQRGPVDKVFPGDEILEIQGFSVVGRRRLEVWNFIKTLASGPVEVVLRRPLKVTQL
uniref:Si:dkey-92i15.4 n=1 Tax=Poecilia formosa TaxID=48698 RepID=A0A096LVY7_POEFO